MEPKTAQSDVGEYRPPTITILGTVEELTASGNGKSVDSYNGSIDPAASQFGD